MPGMKERDKVLIWTYNDGGRAAAGYTGTCGDCVTRAIAIATGLPYQTVYGVLHDPAQGRNAAVLVQRYLTTLGWKWIPILVETGVTIDQWVRELPTDRPLIVVCSRHLTTVMYGVIHDVCDPSGDSRCVYGYWQPGDGTALAD